MAKAFTAELIAPCGMNCGICKTYLAYSRGVPYKKGEVSHCTGCLVRNKNCAFIKRDCDKIRKKQIRFCYECADMPCKELAKIDEIYKARYGMSMVENQKAIREKGMDVFLTNAPTVVMLFRCMMENATSVVFRQKNRKVSILNCGGYQTKN
jgi:hypothetical protein